MVYELKRQPFRALALALTVPVTAFVVVPFWCIWYIPSFNRPRKTWRWWQCVELCLIRNFADLGRVPEKLGPLIAGPTAAAKDPKTKSVWVDPVPKFILGNIKKYAEINKVEPARIPGYWYDRKGHSVPVGEKAQANEKVLYYCHGGGYVALTAHPSGIYNYMINRLTQCHSDVERTFAIEYRLTTGPPDATSAAFPAALMDALAGYVYLIKELGFKPENIIVGGDSAGANLALALVRYLVELGRTPETPEPIPIPSGLLLISPWCDLGTSHETPTGSYKANAPSDYLLPSDSGLLLHARKLFIKDLGFPFAGDSNPYISSGSAHPEMSGISFKEFPKTLITCGGGETLYDMIYTLKNKMVGELGAEWVKFVEGKDAPHDFLLLQSWDVVSDPVYEVIGEWMEAL
ncbi:hypothetical protein QCA50_011718 [Cerrena zonata]|uniref:Alpha/beta hydrolase fold-3 domain-containing protein n=1 Tax=Cerrena zonata TaxID=2478898 RepID=A0AAW0G1Y8_9APHY